MCVQGAYQKHNVAWSSFFLSVLHNLYAYTGTCHTVNLEEAALTPPSECLVYQRFAWSPFWHNELKKIAMYTKELV